MSNANGYLGIIINGLKEFPKLSSLPPKKLFVSKSVYEFLIGRTFSRYSDVSKLKSSLSFNDITGLYCDLEIEIHPFYNVAISDSVGNIYDCLYERWCRIMSSIEPVVDSSVSVQEEFDFLHDDEVASMCSMYKDSPDNSLTVTVSIPNESIGLE